MFQPYIARQLKSAANVLQNQADKIEGRSKVASALPFETLLTAQRTARTVIVSLIVSGIVIIGLIFASASLSGSSTQEEKFQQIFYTTLISVFASVFAGFIYIIFDDRGNFRRIKKIASIADERLLAAIFRDLASYDAHFLDGYKVHIKIKKSPHYPAKLVLLEIRIEISRPIVTRELTATIARSSARSNASGEIRGIVDSELISQKFDESTIPEPIRNDENFSKMYAFRWIQIEGKPQAPPIKSREPEGWIKWRSPLSDEFIGLDIKRRVEFCFEVPMERESYYNLRLDYPTKTFELTVDFTEVADKLDIVLEDSLTSPLCVSCDREQKLGKGQIKLTHSEWMLPGSNVVLVWYER